MAIFLYRRGNCAVFDRLFPKGKQLKRVKLLAPLPDLPSSDRKSWSKFEPYGTIYPGLHLSDCPCLDKIFSLEMTCRTEWYKSAVSNYRFTGKIPTGFAYVTSKLNCENSELVRIDPNVRRIYHMQSPQPHRESPMLLLASRSTRRVSDPISNRSQGSDDFDGVTVYPIGSKLRFVIEQVINEPPPNRGGKPFFSFLEEYAPWKNLVQRGRTNMWAGKFSGRRFGHSYMLDPKTPDTGASSFTCKLIERGLFEIGIPPDPSTIAYTWHKIRRSQDKKGIYATFFRLHNRSLRVRSFVLEKHGVLSIHHYTSVKSLMRSPDCR